MRAPAAAGRHQRRFLHLVELVRRFDAGDQDAGGAEIEEVVVAMPFVRSIRLREIEFAIQIIGFLAITDLNLAVAAHDGLMVDKTVFVRAGDRDARRRADRINLRLEPKVRGVVGREQQGGEVAPVAGEFEAPSLRAKGLLVLDGVAGRRPGGVRVLGQGGGRDGS